MTALSSDPFMAQTPETPLKGSAISSIDPAPKYSPGNVPMYVANGKTNLSSQDFSSSFAEMTEANSSDTISVLPFKSRSTLQMGNIVTDVRNLALNIESFMAQFVSLKNERDVALIKQASAERKLQKAEDEIEGYKVQYNVFETTLSDIQQEMNDVRNELSSSEEKLRLSVTHLADTAKRLELSKSDLRVRTLEKDEIARRLADTVRELQFHQNRSADLQVALNAANAGENAANERNTRLTAMLYHMADVERKKDQAEARARDLEMMINEMKLDRSRDAETKTKAIKLGLDMRNLNNTIQARERERNNALKQVDERNRQIDDLKRSNEELDARAKSLLASNATFGEIAGYYGSIAAGLAHPECRNAFPTMGIDTQADGTVNLRVVKGLLPTAVAGLVAAPNSNSSNESVQITTVPQSNTDPPIAGSTPPKPLVNGQTFVEQQEVQQQAQGAATTDNQAKEKI